MTQITVDENKAAERCCVSDFNPPTFFWAILAALRPMHTGAVLHIWRLWGPLARPKSAPVTRQASYLERLERADVAQLEKADDDGSLEQLSAARIIVR